MKKDKTEALIAEYHRRIKIMESDGPWDQMFYANHTWRAVIGVPVWDWGTTGYRVRLKPKECWAVYSRRDEEEDGEEVRLTMFSNYHDATTWINARASGDVEYRIVHMREVKDE